MEECRPPHRQIHRNTCLPSASLARLILRIISSKARRKNRKLATKIMDWWYSTVRYLFNRPGSATSISYGWFYRAFYFPKFVKIYEIIWAINRIYYRYLILDPHLIVCLQKSRSIEQCTFTPNFYQWAVRHIMACRTSSAASIHSGSSRGAIITFNGPGTAMMTHELMALGIFHFWAMNSCWICLPCSRIRI